MPARLRKLHQDDVRKKIQTSQLINRLQNHALGKSKTELTASQIKAIEILIRKTLPDLSQVTAEFANPNDGPAEHLEEAKAEITELFGPRLVVNNG